MAEGELTFAAIEARLKAMPHGQMSSLKAPNLILRLSIASTCALIVALSPSVLIQFMPPQTWMVALMKYGLLAGIALGLPYFVHGLWVVLRSLTRWNEEMAGQLDHDLGESRRLSEWLQGFPRDVLVQHQLMARRCKIQLESKLALLAGGSHRLGMLPLLAAALSLFWGVDKNLLLPSWWAGGLLAVTLVYWIAVAGAKSVIRFQLYDSLLTDAVDAKSRSEVCALPKVSSCTGSL